MNEFKALQDQIHTNAMAKGFWDPVAFPVSDDTDYVREQLSKIVLMHSELSEAVEAIRKKDPRDSHCPDFGNLEIEMADCVIRIMDFCRRYDLPLWEAMLAKHAFNCGRPYKHGKLI